MMWARRALLPQCENEEQTKARGYAVCSASGCVTPQCCLLEEDQISHPLGDERSPVDATASERSLKDSWRWKVYNALC